MNNPVVWLIRVLFSVLILYELAGYLGLLPFTPQFTWLGLVITGLVTFIVLELVGRHYRQEKKRALHWSIWLIAFLALLVDAVGDMGHFYGRCRFWDQIVHFFVSAAIDFTLFSVISAFWIDTYKFTLLWQKGRLRLATLLAAATTLSFGVIYEIEEYLEDMFFHTGRLGPGTDTANDLLFNFLGVSAATVFLTLHYLITHKREVV